MGWLATSDARAAGASADRTVVLRICPALDMPTLVGILDVQLPRVRFLPDTSAGSTAHWLAELCADGHTVVSTVQNTETGASDTRTWPVPPDAGAQGLERLAAHVLAVQVEAALESLSERPQPERDVPAIELAAASGDPPLRLDLVAGLGFDGVGGLSGRTDEASIAMGPGVRLGALLDRHGYIGFGLRALTVLGDGAGLDLLEIMPLSIEGGWHVPLGPVALQACLAVIGERWDPTGIAWGSGWRAGIGLGGGLVVPLAWLLDFRLEFGVEFFPEGYHLGLDAEETVAELSNWRWRAGAGLGISIPVL
ncbi:MAG: hypothetical protein HY907_11995 [Deltaproteobacteria bacterium]|nr:hypothetical protein [Deltaproteobacteria bacterium]